ncbi:autophagy protein 13 [Dimargaris verticillata]|uniref:Autophagy-related protein 13 n=1 Tax=Dimargaris verticillata TaxID=2761393 RepID=A0A9W8B7V1_9FUNG|nr:autophagy protein 13 [Dimargaris verticillata]
MNRPPSTASQYSDLNLSTSNLSTSSHAAPARDSRGEQITQNFFAKFAQIVTQTRQSGSGLDPASVGSPALRPQSTSVRMNKWFNLELEDREPVRSEVRFWRTAALLSTPPPPLIVEVYLDVSDLRDNQMLVVTDDRLRRWTVDLQASFHDSRTSLPSNLNSSQGSKSLRRTSVLLESWQLQLSHPMPYPVPELPIIYKKAIVYFRLLFFFVRLLPAYQLTKRLQQASRPWMRIGYRLTTAPTVQSNEIGLDTSLTGALAASHHHQFDPLLATLGTFTSSVTYRAECGFHIEEHDVTADSHALNLDQGYFAPTIASTNSDTAPQQPYNIPPPSAHTLLSSTKSPPLKPRPASLGTRRTAAMAPAPAAPYGSAVTGTPQPGLRRATTTTTTTTLRPTSGGFVPPAGLHRIAEAGPTRQPTDTNQYFTDRSKTMQRNHRLDHASPLPLLHPSGSSLGKPPSSLDSRISSQPSTHSPPSSLTRESWGRSALLSYPHGAQAVLRRPSLSIVSPFKSPSLSSSPASPLQPGPQSSSTDTDGSQLTQRQGSYGPTGPVYPRASLGGPVPTSLPRDSTAHSLGRSGLPVTDSITQSPRLSSSFAHRYRQASAPDALIVPRGSTRSIAPSTSLREGYLVTMPPNPSLSRTPSRYRRHSLLSDDGASISEITLDGPNHASSMGPPPMTGHQLLFGPDAAPTPALPWASGEGSSAEGEVSVDEFQQLLDSQPPLQSASRASSRPRAFTVGAAGGTSRYSVRGLYTHHTKTTSTSTDAGSTFSPHLLPNRMPPAPLDPDQPAYTSHMDRLQRRKQSYNYMADSIALNARPTPGEPTTHPRNMPEFEAPYSSLLPSMTKAPSLPDCSALPPPSLTRAHTAVHSHVPAPQRCTTQYPNTAKSPEPAHGTLLYSTSPPTNSAISGGSALRRPTYSPALTPNHHQPLAQPEHQPYTSSGASTQPRNLGLPASNRLPPNSRTLAKDGRPYSPGNGLGVSSAASSSGHYHRLSAASLTGLERRPSSHRTATTPDLEDTDSLLFAMSESSINDSTQ